MKRVREWASKMVLTGGSNKEVAGTMTHSVAVVMDCAGY